MADSLLKKEFKPADLQRARNLINKNFTGSTNVQTGYTKKHIHRVEGDMWEEDGRTWTIKNGIKQNVGKLDEIKKSSRIPITCPRCGSSMNHWLAKKMYRIHGFCFDPCTVEYEAELRKVRLFDQYQKRMVEGNLKAFAGDLEQWLLEGITDRDTFVTEQGDIEDWTQDTSTQKTKQLEKLRGFLENVKSVLDEKDS